MVNRAISFIPLLYPLSHCYIPSAHYYTYHMYVLCSTTTKTNHELHPSGCRHYMIATHLKVASYSLFNSREGCNVLYL